jgi:hypothetical protein
MNDEMTNSGDGASGEAEGTAVTGVGGTIG